MISILIVEDEKSIRSVLKRILLEENKDFEIVEAADGKEGLEVLNKKKMDLVLCDIKMPKLDGIELLQQAMELHQGIPFIMLTGHGTVETAVEAMKLGAYDFIPKPPDLNRLLTTVRNALENKNLRMENKQLKKRIAKKYNIIGESAAIKDIVDLIDRVATTDARVLITGENGTGKELVANQLHQKSERSKRPFVEVNCAAIPSELIESELFGHVKGSFTSAIKDRPGKFEMADGGTLFLDEVADMSLAAQAKVLRALQEKKIQRVGSDKQISVDVRVIAATNKNLKQLVADEKFREDLYHRLAVILIEVPSLAARRSDIPILVNHFTNLLAEGEGMESKEFSAEVIKKLSNYPWSGNIRELRNVVERLMILGDNPISLKNIEQFASK